MITENGETPVRLNDTRSARTKHLLLSAAAVLLIGLASAVAVFVAAEKPPDGEQGYEVAGTFIYPAMQERSKKYQHDLQRFGGKAAVLADDINRWFDGLWRGRALAGTIAVLSAVLSFSLFLAAHVHAAESADGTQHAGRNGAS